MTLRSVHTVPCVFSIILLSAAGLTLEAAPALHGSDHWALERAMLSARQGACAAPLADGGVLIAGGSGSRGVLASAEVYNADGSVSAAGSMSTPRAGSVCTTQRDGSVLVAGGTGADGTALATAELFNPATRRWTSVGAMSMPRSGATASLLIDGRTLIAGGEAFGAATASVEIYDPASQSFRPASAQMSSPRRQHAAAVLADGRVLIAGGSNGSAALNSADIFDPWLGSLSPAGKMSTPRQNLSATRMLDGRVLIAGGSDGSAELSSVETFDPLKGAFQPAAPMAAPRQGHLAFRLPNNNQILLAGGTSAGNAVATTELYTPWTGKFRSVDPLSTPRAGASGAALPLKSKVLIAGGNGGLRAMDTAESFSFATITTDQSDYPPGSTVTITGSGWQPGETVQLVIHGIPTLEADTTLTATADSAGNISTNQFQTDSDDVGVTFYVTATGLQSGLQAQTTFTDSNVFMSRPTLSPSSPVSYGTPVTISSTATPTGTNPPPPPMCGTVTFSYGTGTVGSATPFASVQLNGTSTATVTESTIPVGSWNIFASYDPSTCNPNANGYTTGSSDPGALKVLGSISGTTYTDNNLDMVDDAGDTPLGGVTVTLTNSSNAVVATTVSAPDGSYSFSNLPAGSYTISVPSSASGENLETTSPLTATLGGGVNAVTGENFGYIAPRPQLSLVKTASPTTYSAVGQTITYTYTITNSGNVTLPGPFSISDNKLGTISPCGSGPLATGASTSCTATHTIVQADLDAGSITNIATASTTYNGNPVTSNRPQPL